MNPYFYLFKVKPKPFTGAATRLKGAWAHIMVMATADDLGLEIAEGYIDRHGWVVTSREASSEMPHQPPPEWDTLQTGLIARAKRDGIAADFLTYKNPV